MAKAELSASTASIGGFGIVLVVPVRVPAGPLVFNSPWGEALKTLEGLPRAFHSPTGRKDLAREVDVLNRIFKLGD